MVAYWPGRGNKTEQKWLFTRESLSLYGMVRIMEKRPERLYHGSNHLIEGPLHPILRKSTGEHIHSKAAVFATERIDLAALFMFPSEHIASIGFEEDIAYICIWGLRTEFDKDNGGYIYELPADSFQKIGKDYEYQSFEPVQPITTKFFPSLIQGMMECGVQVYFINDDPTFDRIIANKEHRAPILRNLISENQKVGRCSNKIKRAAF